MAGMAIEDLEGTLDAVAFANTWNAYSDYLTSGEIVLLEGDISTDSKKKTKQIVINRATPIKDVLKMADTVEIIISEDDVDNQEKLESLHQITKDHKGDKNLVLHLRTSDYGTVVAQSSDEYKIDYNQEVIDKIEELFGNESIVPTNRSKRSENFIDF